MPDLVPPHPTLASIENFLKTKAGPEAKSTPPWAKYVLWAAAAALAMAVFWWVSRKQSKELARLRHEAEERKLMAESKALKEKLGAILTEVTQLQRAIDDASDRLKKTEERIHAVQAQRDADRRALDRIRSWSDLDQSNAGSGG